MNLEKNLQVFEESYVSAKSAMLAVWQTGLHHEGHPEAKVKWYYESNPDGLPLVLMLRKVLAADAVGCASVGPRRFQLDKQAVFAGAMIDFVLLPEYRTFFPALLLQRELTSRALGRYSFLYGFPNPKSAPVFGRVGYESVGDLERYARVLRSAKYLSKYLPSIASRAIGTVVDLSTLWFEIFRRKTSSNYVAQWSTEVPNEVDQLFNRAIPNNVLAIWRDKKFLDWRFANVRAKQFNYLLIRDIKTNVLLAYAAYTSSDDVLRVEDFLADCSFPGAAARLWNELAIFAASSKFSSLTVEFMGSEAVKRTLRTAGLYLRESRPCFVHFGREDGNKSVVKIKSAQWYVTTADCDW